MYVLRYPFDPKMKLVVGNMLLFTVPFWKDQNTIQKTCRVYELGFSGLGFFWHCTLCAVLRFFIWKFMGKIVLLFVRSLKTLYMFIC